MKKLFLLLLILSSILDPLSSTAVERSDHRGIYVLGPSQPKGDILRNIGDTAQPFIDGAAVRSEWRFFDIGTTGPQYDFALIVEAVDRLQRLHKKLSLWIEVQVPPKWIIDASDVTYLTVVPGRGSTVTLVKTCAPWGSNVQDNYNAFYHALAHVQVPGPSGGLTNFCDSPTLVTMRISIAGRDHVFRDTHGAAADIPGYTRSKFIGCVTNSIVAVQREFPRQLLQIGMFSEKDGTRTPSLSSALVAALNTLDPKVAPFAELWTGMRPQVDNTTGKNHLAMHAAGSPVCYQALGSWLDKSPGNWDQRIAYDGPTPHYGFVFASTRYQANYFELYKSDLRYTAWRSMFIDWQRYFQTFPQ
jgi:hypothetical protein